MIWMGQLVRSADTQSLRLVRVELQAVLQVPLSDIRCVRGKNRQFCNCLVVTHGKEEKAACVHVIGVLMVVNSVVVMIQYLDPTGLQQAANSTEAH